MISEGVPTQVECRVLGMSEFGVLRLEDSSAVGWAIRHVVESILCGVRGTSPLIWELCMS